MFFRIAAVAMLLAGCAADPEPRMGEAQLALAAKAACTPIRGTDCATRAGQLDAYAGSLSGTLASNCTSGVAMPVGGVLQASAPAPGWSTTATVTRLTFKGKTATMDIYAANAPALQIGKFYGFDLAGKCKYLFSSQLSGLFEGTFTQMACCK